MNLKIDKIGLDDIKIKDFKYLSIEILIEIINENQENFDLPKKEIIKSLCTYLIKKDLLTKKNISIEIKEILIFLEKLKKLTKDANFYKSNPFKYIYDGNNLKEALEQIFENAKFWIDRFGIDFFKSNEVNSKERNTLMMSDIDDDFYLSMKPGSGVGTFSLDFAIGIKGGNTINNLPTKEIWRTGIDTQKIKEIISMRIIRTGGAIKKSNGNFEEKSDMYKLFKKKYGLSPQRALAFLVMYIGKDLKVDEIKAISLIGARQKKLNLIGSKQINFDYTELFKNVGFKETSNPNWLSLGNPKETFYDTLETSPEDLKGLRAYETSGLDKIINAFKNLRDIVDPNKKCPLEICADETKEEIEKAMNTFRKIHNK